jgi:hypothetical protein
VVHLDDGTDPRQRPSLGLEAGPLGPVLEDVEQVLPLGGSQPRGTPRLGTVTPCRESPRVVTELFRPLADRRRTDVDLPGDLGLRETAGAEQAARGDPPLFELFGGEFLWSPHPYESNSRPECC